MKTDLSQEIIAKDDYNPAPAPSQGTLDASLGTGVYFPIAIRELSPRPNRKADPITVLLVESRTIVRQGICAVLAFEKDITVVGQAADSQQAIELTAQLHPDVVLVNIALAATNHLHLTRLLLHAMPAPRVILLARQGDDTYAAEAAAIGASAYVTEQISGDALAKTLREVNQGLTVFPTAPATTKAASPATKPLTARQKQVLQMIAEGNSNKQTASNLSIGIKTVEKHRERLMARLGIHETAGLTRYAISSGIIHCVPLQT
jgi:DNA-binding NarL/FixJ family response regulator